MIKAAGTVLLGNLGQTYDGTAKSVSLTTAPPGLAVDVTYNAWVNAPTNAGSYTVIGTINDPNYQGSATNTLVIGPAGATVTANNVTLAYGQSNPGFTGTTAGFQSGDNITRQRTARPDRIRSCRACLIPTAGSPTTP